eukprot:12416728-Karenia_brevis.AAC.1
MKFTCFKRGWGEGRRGMRQDERCIGTRGAIGSTVNTRLTHDQHTVNITVNTRLTSQKIQENVQ